MDAKQISRLSDSYSSSSGHVGGTIEHAHELCEVREGGVVEGVEHPAVPARIQIVLLAVVSRARSRTPYVTTGILTVYD